MRFSAAFFWPFALRSPNIKRKWGSDTDQFHGDSLDSKVARFKEAFSAAAKAALHRWKHRVQFGCVSSRFFLWKNSKVNVHFKENLNWIFQFLPKRECLNIKSQENSFWSVKNVARSLADTFSWFCCPYLVNAILTAKTWIRCQTCRILLYKCQVFLIKSKSVLRC